MKIAEIRSAGLRGATPEGGWSTELRPEDCVHTLIAVHTDAGLIGLGSVFTNDALVRGALQVLEPLYRGENALEPERVSEKLHQNTFWQGRGGSITHAISGIDIALVGPARQGNRPARRPAAWRTLSRARPPLCLAADAGAGGAGRASARREGAGIPRLQDRLGTVWPDECRPRRSDRQERARDAIGADSLLMVDAGASDAFWPARL